MENIKQKIKDLFKPNPKKELVILDREEYNKLMKQIDFLKGFKTSSSFFKNKIKGVRK